MSKNINYKAQKRVIFPKNKQHQFLSKTREKLKISWPVFAKTINAHPRTLNDWKREEYSLPFGVLKKICKLTGLEMPKSIEIKKPFWSTSKAGKISGNLVYKRYGAIGGDPEYRKKKWYEWWEREGRYKSSFIKTIKPIRKPGFSKDLAEFVGIILGDGSITQRQITVTLHYKDDKEYGKFVVALIKNLFRVPVSKYYREKYSINTFVVSRSKLVKFCTEKLGLKIGNKVKQQIDIPDWIKQNKQYAIACVRGLVDTDGCVFNECHKIKNKKYCYPRLAFINLSKPLLFSVFRILKELGFSPKIRNNAKVQLENRGEIIKYFNSIKSNNPKHKKRFKSFLGGVESGHLRRS